MTPLFKNKSLFSLSLLWALFSLPLHATEAQWTLGAGVYWPEAEGHEFPMEATTIPVVIHLSGASLEELDLTVHLGESDPLPDEDVEFFTNGLLIHVAPATVESDEVEIELRSSGEFYSEFRFTRSQDVDCSLNGPLTARIAPVKDLGQLACESSMARVSLSRELLPHEYGVLSLSDGFNERDLLVLRRETYLVGVSEPEDPATECAQNDPFARSDEVTTTGTLVLHSSCGDEAEEPSFSGEFEYAHFEGIATIGCGCSASGQQDGFTGLLAGMFLGLFLRRSRRRGDRITNAKIPLVSGHIR